MNSELPTYDELGNQISQLQKEIDRLKNSELELTDKLEKYRLLYENCSDAFLLTSPDGDIYSANPAACAMFDMSETEICEAGRDLLVNLNDERIKSLIEYRNIHGHAQGELTCKRKDGTLFEAELTSKIFTDNKGNKRTSMIIRDITTKKEILRKYHDNEAKLKAIFCVLPVGISLIFKDRAIVQMNSYLEKIIKLNSSDILNGKHKERLYLRGDGTIMQPYELASAIAIRENRMVQNVETGVVLEDKSIIWTSVSAAPLHIENMSAVVVTADITELKQKNEALIKAQLLAEETDKQYRQLFENMEQGFAFHEMIYDPEGNPVDYRFLMINKAFKKLTRNFGEENIIGKTVKEILPNTELVWIENYGRVAKTCTPINFESYSAEFDKYYDVVAYSPKMNFFAVVFTDVTKNKKYEQELKLAKEKAEENERFLIASQKIGRIGSFTLDVKSGIWSASEDFDLIFGIEADYPHTIDGFMELLHPDSRENFRTYFNFVSKDKLRLDYEYKIIRFNDKVERWVHGIGDFEYDEHGKPVKQIGIVQDITDRKLAEIIIQDERVRLSTILNTVEDPIFVKDNEHRIVIANKAFYEIFKTDEKNTIGYSLAENVPVNERVHFLARDRSVLDTGIPDTCEESLTVEGNKYTIITRKSRYIDQSGNKFLVGSIHDITDIKNSEIKLLKSKEEVDLNNERLESLLRISQLQVDSNQELLEFALNEAITLTGSKIGYIYFYNEETKQFTLNTWSKDVMKECAVTEPQTVYDLEKTGIWGEAVRQRKTILINDFLADNPLKKGTPDGHVKLKNFLTIPVFFENKIVAVIGVANKETDYNNSDARQLTLLMDNVWKISERINLITNLKAAKEKAEESDRLKTAFIQNMSHEIRTPMNAIMGFSEMLVRNFNNKSKLEYFSDIINQRCKDLLDIINDLLDIAKIESGQMSINYENCNLTQFFDELKIVFCEEQVRMKKKEISFILEVPASLGSITILTDKLKLKQIFTNLLSNAFKFTQKGSIEGGCILNENQQLLFYVSDTGIGIPPDKHQYIFERFSQVEIGVSRLYGGTGLGLSIVKGLVDLLGGSVWLQSEPGMGTTFYFTIAYNSPITNEPIVKSENSKHNLSHFNNKTVLVVEDDTFNFSLIKEILSDTGLNILYAENGKDAIEIALTKSPDLVLMDIGLPDMFGYETIRQILHQKPDTKIIAQTAYASVDDRTKAIDSGCLDYISKPLNASNLLSLVNKYLQ